VSDPLVAISIGCPASIGPEISVAAASRAGGVRPLLVGDPEVLRDAARMRGIAAGRLVEIDDPSRLRRLSAREIAVWAPSARVSAPVVAGRPDRAAGAAQLAWIDEATRLTKAGLAHAMTTAPVSKHAIATSGARGSRGFLGHTEHLAARLGAREVVMAFWSEELVVSLVTTHLALADVPRRVDRAGVARATYWLTRLLSDLGARAPRVAVAALNPHAGEGGLLGDDETRVIAPGIGLAKRRIARAGIRATIEGPLGAETAFRRAVARSFDGVVAMYHDQATIPMKVVSFGEAVNVSLGLPIVRTSVDHGTAYDLAGRGVANEGAMLAALSLAGRLARPRASSRRLSAPASRARS
jgi:4-hydroxythreonine-4-phosphate dehydrogenase